MSDTPRFAGISARPLRSPAGVVARAAFGARRRRNAGFSLVEVMVVVMIISMLAALGVPAIIRVKTKAKVSVIVSDLRVFASAFDAHAQESGGWPAEVDAGVFPAGLTGRLNDVSWQRKTPIGGKYNWENDQLHGGIRPRAAIAISDTDDAPLIEDGDLWLEIDRALDDGNLSTGNFRIGANSEPVYIILP